MSSLARTPTKKEKKKEQEKGTEGWNVARGRKGRDESEEMMKVWENVEICGECERRVNSGEDGMVCDLCKRWFHAECGKLSKKEYEMLNKMEDKVKWYCGKCNDKVNKLTEENGKIKKRMEECEKENRSLKKENEMLKKRVEGIENRIGILEGNCEGKMEEEMKKMSNEIEYQMSLAFDKMKNTWMEKFENMKLEKEEIKATIVKVKNRMDKMDEETKERMRKTKREVETEMADRLKEMEREFNEKQKAEMEGMKGDMENVRKLGEKIGKGDNKERMRQMENMKKEIVMEGMNEIKKKSAQEGKQVEAMCVKIEDMERERRKKNIIIFNLIESEKEEAEQRYGEDLKMCGEIFLEEMGIQDMRVEKVIRIGKKNDNNRPLLVKLGSEEEKKWALSNAKKLRNSEKFERVYLVRDMTEEERRKDRQLREELRDRRQREGESSFIIRRGKIIKIDRREQVQRNGGDSQEHRHKVTTGGNGGGTDQRQNVTDGGNRGGAVWRRGAGGDGSRGRADRRESVMEGRNF